MRRIEIDPSSWTRAELEPAVAWLRAGKVVALPTDTLYGLAVDPASEVAVKTLFQIKGRETSAALPLIAGSRAQVDAWCGLGAAARRLADAFWPGPLSIVCDAPKSVVPAVHAGRRTIAIRVPAHPLARGLAEAFGMPLTSTSANRSGQPPAQRVAELAAIDDERVLVIDGGDTAGGAPSTIVDVRATPPTLIRAGAIEWDRVLHSLNER
ncbi:MAG TPA: L-threonylcarbamoyladenylate synthase [Vicinamibacterales bacterium]|nr:L-threonylcarbamoyladenylate synthase [Vicinamibacterales bacterium]